MAREKGGRNPSKQRRYVENMESERNSAALYLALAECERDANLSSIYRKMAAKGTPTFLRFTGKWPPPKIGMPKPG
jgi:hypothetical protein